MAKLVCDLCTSSNRSPRSTKVSRSLSTDFKKHHLKPPETMLGTFTPEINMDYETFLRVFSLFYSIWWWAIPNQRSPGSWRGGVAWLQMETNLWYFPFVLASKMWSFSWPLGRECRLVLPCGVSICWPAFQFVLLLFPLKEERKAN